MRKPSPEISDKLVRKMAGDYRCGIKVHQDLALWLCESYLATQKKLKAAETALTDLLNCVADDDLIPESVSYMRQARNVIASCANNAR